jgi:hypothetical protein
MRVALAALILGLSSSLLAQSLTEASRREGERRRRAQADGSAPVIGEADLQRARQERARDGADESDGGTAAAESEAPSGGGAKSSDSASPEGPQLDRERKQREQGEKRWRERLAHAQERLEEAQRRYDSLKDLTLPPGGYAVDHQGRVTIDSPQTLQHMVAQARRDLEAAQKALDDLLEEARQEGVPPGWLR